MAIIEVNHLTKEYQLGHLASLKETAINTIKRLTFRKVQARERFKALNDVSFRIEEGEVVGIIGHNGAGKSTLLKHLANISKPTKGNVIVRGSVAPLIEVGAGINPELTGRENIFLNAAILGIPKKVIKQKLDEIIEFSELEQFIDTPVKRYSSGMKVKLGFSIATSINADILIIDEVLAVGDLAFQNKCFRRMEKLIDNNNSTVLVVSHNIRQIRKLCSRVILLDHGKVYFDGPKEQGCDLFYDISNKIIQSNTESIHKPNKYRGTGDIKLNNIQVVDNNNKPIKFYSPSNNLIVKTDFYSQRNIADTQLIVGVHTTDFLFIIAKSTIEENIQFDIKKGHNSVTCNLDTIPFAPGIYCVWFGIVGNKRETIFAGETLTTFQVRPNNESIKPERRIIETTAKWVLKK